MDQIVFTNKGFMEKSNGFKNVGQQINSLSMMDKMKKKYLIVIQQIALTQLGKYQQLWQIIPSLKNQLKIGIVS